MSVQNTVVISNNELIQDVSVSGVTPIYEVIKDTLALFYKNGVRVAEIDIACADYADGAVDWQTDGEIPKVGEIVRFDDDVYWRVTGRRFSHSGAPRVHLELQEVTG